MDGTPSSAHVANAWRARLFRETQLYCATLMRTYGLDPGIAGPGVIVGTQMVVLAHAAGIIEEEKFPRTAEEYRQLMIEGIQNFSKQITEAINLIDKDKKFVCQFIEIDNKAGSKD